MISYQARLLVALLIVLFANCSCRADERPNVLWITSEDNAAHWMGCYGNEQAQTPNVDRLAERSLVFENAYSNAPVCAVARCTLLHGMYSVTLGTQHMRSRYPIPSSIKPYVSYLRDAGYYCTNRSKTDFNREGDDKDVWDACGGKAHYRNRADDQPFFSVFNLTVCHESCLFPKNVKRQREREIIPSNTRLKPEQITLPPYLPDLPEIRRDFAIYHDYLTVMDRQVAALLDELRDEGLSDDTIVFYYSDHGGPTPRGKRYLKDTGVRVPMIVHVPERWRHLVEGETVRRTSEPVSFVDLAPTLLSICGIAPPHHMQGRAFLGVHRRSHDGRMTFLFGDRFDEINGMRRGITDGRFKYIRRFTPQLPAAPYSYYQFSMPSWVAWYEATAEQRLSGRHQQIWGADQPVEELFDLSADPWETMNLAADPKHAERLAEMRGALKQTMNDVGDCGVIPEPLFGLCSKNQTMYEFASANPGVIEALVDLAFVASARDRKLLPEIVEALDAEQPAHRFWAIQGCWILGDLVSQQAREKLASIARNDDQMANRAMAKRALVELDASNASQWTSSLLAEAKLAESEAERLLLSNLATQLNANDQLPPDWLREDMRDYVRRFAYRAASE